jgi:hypothetical protein
VASEIGGLSFVFATVTMAAFPLAMATLAFGLLAAPLLLVGALLFAVVALPVWLARLAWRSRPLRRR